MSTIDPEDESLDRWVVQGYRFDPARRERRNVDEIAFDKEAEFLSYIERAARRLDDEKAAGAAEQIEKYSGMHRPPGHREQMQRRRKGEGGRQ